MVSNLKEILNNFIDSNKSYNSNTQELEVALYIVATPIGNLQDITLRAIGALAAADIIVCEDTRVSNKLLNIIGIPKKTMLIYNDHSNEKDREKILGLVDAGKSVVIISDAGTPLISDPGFKLVKSANEKNIKVVTVPGASSVISALTISTLPTNNFFFAGFLPSTEGARNNVLKELSDIKTTLIFFESANRLVKAVKSIVDKLGDPNIAICREITKKYEEVIRGKASDVLQELLKREVIKGEIVLLIDNSAGKQIDDKDLKEILKKTLKSESLKDTVQLISERYSQPKKKVYNMALAIKDEK